MYPRCNDGTLLLPPRLFGSTAYYAVMALYGSAVIDTSMPFHKRAKLTHRYSIADANGAVDLTVPIEKPDKTTGSTWRDIRISGHGQWWHVHLTALQSAYGRTPFFEYYIDDFLPLFTAECAGMTLMDYLTAADAILRRRLHITPPATPYLTVPSSICAVAPGSLSRWPPRYLTISSAAPATEASAPISPSSTSSSTSGPSRLPSLRQ